MAFNASWVPTPSAEIDSNNRLLDAHVTTSTDQGTMEQQITTGNNSTNLSPRGDTNTVDDENATGRKLTLATTVSPAFTYTPTPDDKSIVRTLLELCGSFSAAPAGALETPTSNTTSASSINSLSPGVPRNIINTPPGSRSGNDCEIAVGNKATSECDFSTADVPDSYNWFSSSRR
jgi:hypothetical protein